MDYHLLGRTGLRVSTFGLGCMTFPQENCGENQSREIIKLACDMGINFFDTANVYAKGKSEEILGQTLSKLNYRNRVVISTKCHNSVDQSNPNASGLSRKHILEECNSSLKRLNTDYVDIFYLHRPRFDTAIDESLRAIDDLIRSGKVRYIGTSTFSAWEIVETLWVSKELGLNRVNIEQSPYNLLERSIEGDVLPMAQTHSIGVITWAPLAYGLLTGKYNISERISENSRLDTNHPKLLKLLSPEIKEKVARLELIANSKSCSLTQLAIAWVSRNPSISIPLIGATSTEQLSTNLASSAIKISTEDERAIDDVVAPGCSATNFFIPFNNSKHLHRW